MQCILELLVATLLHMPINLLAPVITILDELIAVTLYKLTKLGVSDHTKLTLFQVRKRLLAFEENICDPLIVQAMLLLLLTAMETKEVPFGSTCEILGHV